jgi:hypothetical protein
MLAEILAAHAANSEREWPRDRSNTVGASEIGQCARRVWFSKNEDDPAAGRARDGDHEDRWGAKVRGRVYESAWWEPALRARFGDRLLYAGDEQRTFVDGFLSATPDALVVGLEHSVLVHLGVPDIEGDSLLCEAKTADPRTNLREPKPEHVYQVQVQLGLVRAKTNHRPMYGLLTYTDTSFWDEVKEFPIRFDEKVYAAAQRRAMEIMTAPAGDRIRPEGIVAGGRECLYCAFAGQCGQARAAAVPQAMAEIGAAEAREIAVLALAAKAARAAAEQNEMRARELEQDIRDRMGAAGTKKVSVNGMSVTWSAVKGRPSWDHKALREAAEAAGLDIDEFCTVGAPGDRLVITHRQEESK